MPRNGARIGLAADTKIGDRMTLGVDLAYFLGHLTASDTHWLRIGNVAGIDFSGPTPMDGRANGILTDARLDYRLTDNFTIGIGGRYWKMQSREHVYVRFDQTAVPVGQHFRRAVRNGRCHDLRRVSGSGAEVLVVDAGAESPHPTSTSSAHLLREREEGSALNCLRRS